MTRILATDLKPELLKDSFMGKGFEELLAKYELNDEDLIIGEFNDDWKDEVAE